MGLCSKHARDFVTNTCIKIIYQTVIAHYSVLKTNWLLYKTIAPAPTKASKAEPSIPNRAAAPVCCAVAADPLALWVCEARVPDGVIRELPLVLTALPEEAALVVLGSALAAPLKRLAPSTMDALPNVTSVPERTSLEIPVKGAFAPDAETVQVISVLAEL